MKISVKSALLSGLVFPGAGQMYLKRYRMASLLIIIVLTCISLLVMEAIEQATKILEEIESSGTAVNAINIGEISARAAENADTTTSSIATLLIVACWFIGIIDAYRSGKLQTDEKKS
jgi:TM2 domain-containing membrane protein YozV